MKQDTLNLKLISYNYVVKLVLRKTIEFKSISQLISMVKSRNLRVLTIDQGLSYSLNFRTIKHNKISAK